MTERSPPRRSDQMWGTDMTPTVTLAEGTATVFVAMDHATAECVGFHVAKSGNRFEALEPMRQGMRERFGGYAAQIAAGLSLRHDPGSAYLSEVFQDELRFLGIQSLPAFVRLPQGNGGTERFICTLKENLLWVCAFTLTEDLRMSRWAFQELSNRTRLIEWRGANPDSSQSLTLGSSPVIAAFKVSR